MRPRSLLVVCAVIAAGVVGYALLSPAGVPKLRDKRADLAALKSDVEQLERENARLAVEASRLREESPRAAIHLEDAAREELGWVKPDEHVLLLEGPADDQAAAARDSRGEAP